MADKPYRPQSVGLFRSPEIEALWRVRTEDNERVDGRLDRMESSLTVLKGDVDEVKDGIGDIRDAEKRRADSVEKRNQRFWQIGGTILAALAVALVIAVVKVFLPLAAASVQSRPPTVNEQLDSIHHEIGSH